MITHLDKKRKKSHSWIGPLTYIVKKNEILKVANSIKSVPIAFGQNLPLRKYSFFTTENIFKWYTVG